jgi:sirohydrochlorin ferrochelatase
VVRGRAARHGLPGLEVRAAFLDHAAPSLPQALGSVAGSSDECVVTPLLLTAAYHSKTDIPGQITTARSVCPYLRVRYADPLGPHPLLLTALERRLAEAGDYPRHQTSVVLAAAGSSDPAANAANTALAAHWQELGGWRRVVPAFASAASPSVAGAVRGLLADGGPVVVATYLLAPGFFADRVRAAALAAGATAVSGALGAAPEVADLVLRRYLAATARADLTAPIVARA